MPTLSAIHRAGFVVVLAIIAPCIWFFGSAILLGQVFAFRDVANFYYPLFEWECQQWSQGSVPLWNPHDNCGTPVLADASSSVLYPGKLIFALPLDFSRRFNLYIALHVLLAAWAAYLLARHMRASIEAAGLCAVSYAFGGSLLFQYTNVIYLVGAAWLPLAILATDRMLTCRSPLHAMALAVVLALMTLGGDPQTAYHAVLLAAIYAWLLRSSKRSPLREREGQRTEDRGQSPQIKSAIRHPLLLLLVAVVSGLLLSAVQVLPSLEWAKLSDRAAYHAPRSIYEVVDYVKDVLDGRRSDPTDIFAGLLETPQRDTHLEYVYQFSVEPWRLIELVWPNVTGRMFPTHRRWLGSLLPEGRVWTPSLYIGLLPFVLAAGSWQVRNARLRVRWLSLFTLFALLASFGSYGIGWLVHELRVGLGNAAPQDAVPGHPVGGVYWLLVVLLPGYVMFRYPAKWLVVASLGASLLAARGWDQAVQGNSAKLRKCLAWIGFASFTAAVVSIAARRLLCDSLAGSSPDRTFGPLHISGAASDITQSLAHTCVVCLVLCYVLARSEKGSGIFFGQGLCPWARRLSKKDTRPRELSARSQPPICVEHAQNGAPLAIHDARRCRRVVTALLVTAADLMVAQAWMLPTVFPALWRETPAAVRAMTREEQGAGIGRVFRASPRGWQPTRWSRESSTLRLPEVVRWERSSLLPKYHLPWEISLVESYSSIMSNDFRTLLRVARQRGQDRGDGFREPNSEILNALSAQYIVWPQFASNGHANDNGPVVYPFRAVHAMDAEGIVLFENPDAFPKAWVVHSVETLPPLKTNDPRQVERRTQEVFFPRGRSRDLRTVAVVECEQTLARNATTSFGGEFCRLLQHSGQRIELDVQLKAAGLVVVNDLFYPGWQAETTSSPGEAARSVPILRANRILRGVPLPAGRHRLTLEYWPFSFVLGAVLTILGGTAVLALSSTPRLQLARSARSNVSLSRSPLTSRCNTATRFGRQVS